MTRKKVNLYSLDAEQLLEVSKKSINIAFEILQTDALINKLGCHVKGGKLFGSSYFWKTFNPNFSSDFFVNTGYYLYYFLLVHKDLYDLAKYKSILDRLSDYQKEALDTYYTKENDPQFYKRYTA